MRILSIREMCGVLEQLDQLLDYEGERIVTRRGRAMARVMPSHSDHRSLLPKLSPSEELVREDRDGR